MATYFDYPTEIRRIIYTTNSVESYHRQLRMLTKTKAAFPTPEAARNLMYLATQRVTRHWNTPIRDWLMPCTTAPYLPDQCDVTSAIARAYGLSSVESSRTSIPPCNVMQPCTSAHKAALSGG